MRRGPMKSCSCRESHCASSSKIDVWNDAHAYRSGKPQVGFRIGRSLYEIELRFDLRRFWFGSLNNRHAYASLYWSLNYQALEYSSRFVPYCIDDKE